MADDSKSLSEIIKERNATSPAEHILNVLKAGLATAPFCGGIASLMSDYIPNSKQSRLEEFAEKVAGDLDALQGKVDESIILTGDFAFTFEKCFRGAAENYQREKLEVFRGILINSALGSDLQENEKEYLLNLVTTLSVLHMRVLKFTSSPLQYLEENDIPQESISSYRDSHQESYRDSHRKPPPQTGLKPSPCVRIVVASSELAIEPDRGREEARNAPLFGRA